MCNDGRACAGSTATTVKYIVYRVILQAYLPPFSPFNKEFIRILEFFEILMISKINV